MKKHNLAAIGVLVILGWLLNNSAALAQTASKVERVTMVQKQMWTVEKGRKQLMADEVKLPFEILVKTNGTYSVKEGKAREFKEGQILGADGMLLSPDGSITPVFDHIVIKAGRPKIMRDGSISTIQAATPLGNGSMVYPNGFIRLSNGQQRRMLDGQMYHLDGQPIPTKDTITLINGKVSVQKDGSLFSVPPGRSLMMNDGTKVFGDGALVLRDGTKKTLAEGEVYTVPGVVVRH